MEELDLAHAVASTGEYEFKHALVRDAVYQSLLTEPRMKLHLRIAEEVERRSGNRLLEAAETLAHHYRQAERPSKAFVYSAMAGAKSLHIYSFEEAGHWFDAAFSLIGTHPDCATDSQVTAALADYVQYLNFSFVPKTTTAIIERFSERIDRGGDSQPAIVIHHHYAMALVFSGRYPEARGAQDRLSAMAERIGDTPAAAYALTSGIFLSAFFVPESAETCEASAARAISAADEVDDPYLQYILRLAIGLDLSWRGRATKAMNVADDLLAVGRRINDGRSIGLGMAVKSFVATTGDDYGRSLDLAESGIMMARTRADVLTNRFLKISALSALSRPECLALAREFRDECAENGLKQLLDFSEGAWGTALIIHGRFGAGLRWLEASISRLERDGLGAIANWFRLVLAEVYVRMISGGEKPPLRVVGRNLFTILHVAMVAEARVKALVKAVSESSYVDREGTMFARCEMILGLLCKAKKRRSEAVSHLTEAKRLLAQLGPTPALDRVDLALRDLQ